MSTQGTLQENQAPLPRLEECELAALQAAARLGLLQAGSALEQLLGTPVQCETPRLFSADALAAAASEPTEPGEPIVLCLKMHGEPSGFFIVVLNRPGTRQILELFFKKPATPGDPLGELELSALKEVGNILASACFNALGDALHTPLLPMLPVLFEGNAAQLLTSVLREVPDQAIPLCAEARFSIAGAPSSGTMYLVPDAPSWQRVRPAQGLK